MARDFQAVWSAPTTDARLKKRIVRTLIHEAVADIDDGAAEIVLTLHWVGGAHTEHRLPRRRRGQRTSTPADIIEAVRSLALIARIFSSAEKCRRVARRMSLIASSAGCFSGPDFCLIFAPCGYDDPEILPS